MEVEWVGVLVGAEVECCIRLAFVTGFSLKVTVNKFISVILIH